MKSHRNRPRRLAVTIAQLVLPSSLWAQDVVARHEPPPIESGRTLRVNGFEMYYEDVGEGPPLLLLHRYGSCGEIWQPHRERLGKERRLIIPDLRGHGRSSDAAGPFRHDEAARDVIALLDALGVESTEAIGISSGGMTLIHLATRQPERIRAMVLVGATTYFPDEARAIMRRSTPEQLSADELAVWGACSARGDGQTRALLRDFHALKDSYDDMNFTEPYLGTITARTLIVHGDRDEFFPVTIAMDMYRAIPGAALWVMPESGHIPIFGARAAAFQEEVLRFLGAP